MSPLIKFALATLILLLFFALFCLVWLEDLELQAIGLLLLSLVLIVRRGLNSWFRQLKGMLPFTITLALVYLAFAVLQVRTPGGEQGTFGFWAGYGGVRIILLISSLLAVRVLYSFVSFDDILGLPVSISLLKYVILGKLLYEASFSSYRDIVYFQGFIPSLLLEGRSFRGRFRARLSSLLALLYYIIGEAKFKGELIDNRIRHCHHLEE
jgi:hypothetical protein